MNNIFEASLLASLLGIMNEQYQPLDQSFLKEYIINTLGISNPPRNLIKRIEDYFHYNEILPDDIDSFSRWNIESCLCGAIYPDILNDAVMITSEVLKKENKLLTCDQILIYLEFFRQEGRIPDHEELIQYLTNLRNITTDPERFHQDNKMRIPTPNLNLLQPVKCVKEDNCGLCFETITEEEDCYRLPCNHIFHNEEDKCLSTTVKKWLSENKCCPICKKEVILKNI